MPLDRIHPVTSYLSGAMGGRTAAARTLLPRAAEGPSTARLTHCCPPCHCAAAAIGISGSRQSIFAAEIDDGMALPAGGGGLRDHGEAIEVAAAARLLPAQPLLPPAPAPLAAFSPTVATVSHAAPPAGPGAPRVLH